MDAQAKSSKPRHTVRWVILLVVLVVLGPLVKRFFVPAAPPQQVAHPVPVRTVQVKQQAVPIAMTGVGNVLPVMSVTVRPRVDGQLDRVEFKEGQDVKAGQLLARIDPRTYQAQVDQITAQKAKDEAQLANARADLARYEELIKDDATTRQQLDTQRALVNQLQATIKNDNAQIEYAKVNLGYTTINAPISGRVGARLVDPGNIVHAADTTGLLVINQIDPIAVQFTLPEASFQNINNALRANKTPLHVRALDRNTHEVLAEGELVLVNNQIDTSTGTITLKAHFPNTEHKLWPGQSVDARVVLGTRSEALTVPAPVVQRSQDGYFVYVVGADDKVSVQPIEVASTDDGMSVVTQGLQPGQRVVLDGQYRLTPGAHIVEMGTGKGQKPNEKQASSKARSGGDES
jgi:multidrug efflux system membrane fusion protein